MSPTDHFTAALVLTELVSNAIRHGCGDPAGHITVSIARVPGTVRVEVAQPRPLFDPGAVREREPGPDGGWGVLIVERMTRAWGLDRGSRTAWAEVPVDSGHEQD